MGRQDRQLIGESEEPLAHGPVEAACEDLGLIGRDEVGAGGGGWQQRASAEEGERAAAVREQIREVLRGMAGRGEGAQAEPAEIDVLVVVQSAMRVLDVGGRRCQHAGTARPELSILRKLVEPPQQLAEGNRDGPGQVSRSELVTGANVEDQEVLTGAQTAPQVLACNGLQLVPGPHVGADQPLHLGQPIGGQGAQRRPEPVDLRGREPVEDGGPLPPVHHQAGLLQHLEVPARVGHRELDLLRQGLHAAFTVGEHVEDLDSPAARERCADAGELVEELGLEPVVSHCSNIRLTT